MKTYRITIYHDMKKKKRRINVEAHGMTGAIEIVEYHHMNHVVDEIIKAERWDNKK